VENSFTSDANAVYHCNIYDRKTGAIIFIPSPDPDTDLLTDMNQAIRFLNYPAALSPTSRRLCLSYSRPHSVSTADNKY
jgi:hypothetical protein